MHSLLWPGVHLSVHPSVCHIRAFYPEFPLMFYSKYEVKYVKNGA